MNTQNTKPPYVFKICQGGHVCKTLDSAVQYICEMVLSTTRPANSLYAKKYQKWLKHNVSKPFVTKIKGGYMVTFVTSEGKIWRNRIDVIKPDTKRYAKRAFVLDTKIHNPCDRPEYNYWEEIEAKKANNTCRIECICSEEDEDEYDEDED